MKLTVTPEICVPKNDTEKVIQITAGPHWSGERWEWSFFMFWWDLNPAWCGKCGRCTNPANVEPCGHPESKRKIRGQVFVSSLEETEKRIVASGHSVRYVREGKDIGSIEAKTVKEGKKA